MQKSVILGVAAAALASGSAMADFELPFKLDGPGGNENLYKLELLGSLAGANVAVDFVNEGGFTWAGDLLIGFIDPSGNGVEFGGFDLSFGLPSAGDFPSSWDSSTSGAYAYNFSLEKFGLGGEGVWQVLLADGYTQGEAADHWAGVLNLEGVSAVPAPGALALLGLAGMTGVRRRRK